MKQDDSIPVQSTIIAERKELLRQAGDTNGDGVLSAQEIFTALENGQQSIAAEFIVALTQDNVAAYVDQRKSTQAPDTLRASAQKYIQEVSDYRLNQAKQMKNPEGWFILLKQLDKIEIPADLDRMAKDMFDEVIAVPMGPRTSLDVQMPSRG